MLTPLILSIVAAFSVFAAPGRTDSSFHPTTAKLELRATPVAAATRALHVDGRAFRTADGARFAWRGLTAFRLAEMVAHGRVNDAAAVLDWAAAHGVTVVRVLAMADVLFKLSPADGRAALPGLLRLAADRGLVVEVVALADTGRVHVDLTEQVRAVGAICAQQDNCVLELANEPWARQTQSRETGDPKLLHALRALVPVHVAVSLGSAPADDSDAYAGGDYLTVHLARAEGDRGWRHVLRAGAAEALSARTGKPVVDDEPIGAADRSEPGRRDARPERWFAKGVLSRLLGVGATFHFEGGLQAGIPRGVEAACFEAWRSGLDALPPLVEDRAVVKEPGSPDAAIASFDARGAEAVYLAQGDREAWAVAIGVTGNPGLHWRTGWRAVDTRSREGVTIIRAERGGS